MNEVESVRVQPDTGQRSRWGMKQYFYRQDGKKETINRKYLMGAVLGAFFVSTIVTILQPSDPVARDTIPMSEGGAQAVDVPMAAQGGNPSRPNAFKSAIRYRGLEIVKRPGVGKIPPGIRGRAQLMGGASNGPVTAVLIEPVMVVGETILESGTKIYGSGSSSGNRLSVNFSKTIHRDGSTAEIRAVACDAGDKVVGIRGSQVKKYASAFMAEVGLNVLSALAEGNDQRKEFFGASVWSPRPKNVWSDSAKKAAGEQSKEILGDWKEQNKIIEVPDGSEICVLFTGE